MAQEQAHLKDESRQSSGQSSLKQEMDYWVKDFDHKFKEIGPIRSQMEENKQNIDYNYELIKELKNELQQLRKEIAQLKHFSIIAMKSRPLPDLNLK